MNEKLKSTRSYFLDGYNTHSLDVGMRWIAFWRICDMENINYKRIKRHRRNENNETGYFQEESGERILSCWIRIRWQVHYEEGR